MSTRDIYERDKVVKIINTVIDTIAEKTPVNMNGIYQELKELQAIIIEARAEISRIRPEDINGKFVPTATDELDAVVAATAEASGRIMDSCDAIQNDLSHMQPDVAARVQDQVTLIYEACSFQDITGQRITKVLRSLRQIEEHVHALVDIIGRKIPGSNEYKEERKGDDALLNGPALPHQHINQDDIDKILASLDNKE